MFLSNFLGMLSAFILIWGQTNLRIRNVGVAQRTSNTHTRTWKKGQHVLATDIRCAACFRGSRNKMITHTPRSHNKEIESVSKPNSSPESQCTSIVAFLLPPLVCCLQIRQGPGQANQPHHHHPALELARTRCWLPMCFGIKDYKHVLQRLK